MQTLKGLILPALVGLAVCLSCTKVGLEPDAGRDVPIEFNLAHEALTKATVVDASTLASTGFYANATTGALGAETAVWTNARFTVSGDRYRSDGKVWPDGADPHYRFYASNVSLTHGASGPTVNATNGTDVVVAINDSPAYKTANGLSFTHIFGRIGSVVVEAESGFTISGINIRLTPVTGGTYSLREGAGHTDRKGWSGLTTGTATTIATAVGGNANDLYVVPGTYTLTATWTASKNGASHTFTDKTVDVTVSAGMHNTITLTLGGGNLKYAAKFSVSAAKQVEFAPGNLQAVIGSGPDATGYIYTASSWKFAEHQWDYIGNAAGNTSLAAGTTVDLFGWVGASASYDSYGLCTNNSSNNAYYGISKSDALKTDWGSIPGVVSACGDGWYTLTMDEWKYVISERASGATVNGTSDARYTYATINTDGTGVNGIILFSDGVTIIRGEATAWGAINNTSAWATKCTTAQWSALESKGCVFLPAAGLRSRTSVGSVGSMGNYWSGTPYPSGTTVASYRLSFNSSSINPQYDSYRHAGFYVRLAREIN